MKDALNATSTATLTINVQGSGTDDPDADNDTATAAEAGGTSNATAGANPTGNVLTNDVINSSKTALVVTGVKDTGKTAFTAVSASTTSANGTSIYGEYGKLVLGADGTWVYTVYNSTADVDQSLSATAQAAVLARVSALLSTDTVNDTFVYQITNSGGTDSATLTIAVTGKNDAPVALDNAGTAIATGSATQGFNPSGNLLINDSDVDHNSTQLKVTAARTGTEAAGTGTALTVGTSYTAQYGNIIINADGSWSYTLNNANASVIALGASQTLTEVFTYTVKDNTGTDTTYTGLTDTAQLTITIEGANDAPTITANRTSGAPAVVYESALSNGSAPNSSTNLKTATGTLTVGDPDGLSNITSIVMSSDKAGVTPLSLTISNNNFQTQLVNQTLILANGSITFTAYDSTTGVLTYQYTLTSPTTDIGIDNDSGNPAEVNIFKTVISDGSKSAEVETYISIVDDVPSVSAGTVTLTGLSPFHYTQVFSLF